MQMKRYVNEQIKFQDFQPKAHCQLNHEKEHTHIGQDLISIAYSLTPKPKTGHPEQGDVLNFQFCSI